MIKPLLKRLLCRCSQTGRDGWLRTSVLGVRIPPAAPICFVSIMVLQATLNRRDLGSSPRRSTNADGAGRSCEASNRTPTSMGMEWFRRGVKPK